MKDEGSGNGATFLRRCHECGHPIGKKEVFCPRCGARQPRKLRARAMK